MTADLELLELAAKAAGVDPALLEAYREWDTGRTIREAWNPLTDDGDAFRLAAKLRLDIYNYDERMNTGPATVVVIDHKGREDTGVMEEVGADPAAATRRAIVRAAAAIGGAA